MARDRLLESQYTFKQGRQRVQSQHLRAQHPLSALLFTGTMASDHGKPSPPTQGLKLRGSPLLHETAGGNLKHNHPLVLLNRERRSDMEPVGLAQNKQTGLLSIVILNRSCAF